MSDRVLVALDREEADFVRSLLAGATTNTGDGAFTALKAYHALRAALDTDRGELVARIAGEILDEVLQHPDHPDTDEAARAVLALLENGGEA